MSTGTPSREPQTCVCVGASCDVLNNVVQEVFRKPSLLLSRTALIPVIQTVAGWHFFCATHYEAPRLQPVIAVDYISMTPAQSITRDNAELSTGLGTRNVPKTPFGVDSEPSGPKIERQSVSEALPHAKFFYQHDMITIWVEHVLFRVPRYSLTKHSPLLTELLSKHPLNASDAFMLNDYHPDVTSTAFENLLLRLCPPDFDEHPVSTLKHWEDVLHLSSLWRILKLRIIARQAIFDMASPVEQIVLAQRYEFHDWLLSALKCLLAREDHLTCKESDYLGIELATAIYGARMRVRASESLYQAHIAIDRAALVLTQIIVAPAIRVKQDVDATTYQEPLSRRLSLPRLNAYHVREHHRHAITTWIRMAKEPGRTETVQPHITKHLKTFPHHAEYVIDTLLQDCLARLQMRWSHLRCGVCWLPDIHADFHLAVFHELNGSTTPLNDAAKQVAAWLARVVGNWGSLLTTPVDPIYAHLFYQLDRDELERNFSNLPSSFRDMIAAAYLLRHFVNDGLLNIAMLPEYIFSNFWIQMTSLCAKLLAVDLEHVAVVLKSVLIFVGPSVTINQSQEMLTFFDHVQTSAALLADHLEGSMEFKIKQSLQWLARTGHYAASS